MNVGRGAVLVGVALAAAHLAAAPLVERLAARAPLAVETTGPRVVADPATLGPAGALLGGRADEDDQGAAPGLVRHRWRARYRGGFERAVGRVRLLGPLQDVTAPPCGGRLVVGQRLLDDGHAGPGTVAAVVAHELAHELADLDNVAAGKLRRVSGVSLRWSSLVEHPGELGMFPASALRAPLPTGYLRIEAVLELDRVSVPIVVGALPRIDGGQLGFAVGLRARLDFDNRVLDWLDRKLGADRLVTKVARGQLDASLLAALGPPPPLALPGGRTLTVELCPDRPVDIVSGSHAAVPVRWKLGGPHGDEAIAPARHGPLPWPAPDPAAALSLDLDLDGLDGLAYELWRTGWLDEQLAALDLPGRFAADPRVAELLTVRLGPPRLTLPPSFAAGPDDRLRLALALGLDVHDGGRATPGVAWGQLDVGLAATTDASAVALRGLDLTCEPTPGRLEPCYADLVSLVRDGTGDVGDALTTELLAAVKALFVGRRLATDTAPATLVITDARPLTRTVGGQAMLRVELAATLEPAR